MANQRITELEAVNEILSQVGEDPVSTLTGSLPQEVANAQTMLGMVAREVQREGWHWNTEEDYEFTPNVSNNIVVPQNVARIDFSRRFSSGNADPVLRDDKLYDRRNHTFTFTSVIKAEVVWFLDFEDIPDAARWYITIRAGRKFIQRYFGDQSMDTWSKEDEEYARAQCMSADITNGDYNMLNAADAAYTLRRPSRD